MADQPASDPIAMWRQWVSDSERQWNTYLNEAMATEQFSQSMGSFMDFYLNFQKNMNDSMGRYFTALNIPTRTDVLQLGDRLSAIEDRLVTMEMTLGSLRPQTTNDATGLVEIPRPARTRRPDKAG